MADLDWAEMEGLFCQQAPPIVPPAACSTNHGAGTDADRRRREPTEVLRCLEFYLLFHQFTIFFAAHKRFHLRTFLAKTKKKKKFEI